MKATTEKDMAVLDAGMKALKDKNFETLKGPFTGSLVYRGLNCSPEHQVAAQEAYNSLPALVRDAFERTGFHIEGCGSNLDMAAVLNCEPPAMALGVTDYDGKRVMIAEYSFGPDPDTGKGIVVGNGAAMSPLNTTLAHEIGHVLDWACPQHGRSDEGFILALVADLEHSLTLPKSVENAFRLQTIAVNAPDPVEVFAESFAFAIGFGGHARGADFAGCFPKSIAYVRGWFERNYDKFTERLAA